MNQEKIFNPNFELDLEIGLLIIKSDNLEREDISSLFRQSNYEMKKNTFSEHIINVITLNNVTKINSRVLRGCKNLIEAHFTENIKTILNSSFQDCTSLALVDFVSTELDLSFAQDAFKGCPLITFYTTNQAAKEEIIEYSGYMGCPSAKVYLTM